MQGPRILIGFVFWIALVGAGLETLIAASDQEKWHQIVGAFRLYFSPRQSIMVQADESCVFHSGEPIFAEASNQKTCLVGEIGRVEGRGPGGKRPIEVILYSSARTFNGLPTLWSITNQTLPCQESTRLSFLRIKETKSIGRSPLRSLNTKNKSFNPFSLPCSPSSGR